MYHPPMALNRPALVDALTDAGLGAEAVRNEIGGLRNEMRTEFAAVRSEMASMRREMTLMRWMIGMLFVTQGTTLGIVIAKLL